jgi:hypothetical protein
VTISPVHSGTMGQERDEIWNAETRLQPIFSKSDRLLLEREELNNVEIKLVSTAKILLTG